MEAQEGEAKAEGEQRGKIHKSEKEKKTKQSKGENKRTKEARRRMAAVRWIHGVNTLSLSQVVRTPIYLEGERRKRKRKKTKTAKQSQEEKKRKVRKCVERDTDRKTDIKDKLTDRPQKKSTQDYAWCRKTMAPGQEDKKHQQPRRRGEEEKEDEMERVDYSALFCAILHFKQLVDLSSQACGCSSDSSAVPAVI